MIEDEYTYNGKGATGQNAVVEHYQITTAEFGTVDAALLPELRRRKAEREKAAQNNQQPQHLPACPINTGINSECKGEACAWYVTFKGCALAGSENATRDTAGRKCPLNNYKCVANCALYKNGCTFMAIKNESEV